MAQHKWHKEIKAWADGVAIESKDLHGRWYEVKGTPFWDDYEFRIKPQPKEPQYLYAYAYKDDSVWLFNKPQTCLDGIIGKIKLEVEDESTNSN
jgi:hypothetical protein